MSKSKRHTGDGNAQFPERNHKRPNRKKNTTKGSENRFIEAAFELSCRLAGVPGPDEELTREQIMSTIIDLTARKSGVPRNFLEAMPEAEWRRVVEAHMPQSNREKMRLVVDEWSRRIREAWRLVVPGLDEA